MNVELAKAQAQPLTPLPAAIRLTNDASGAYAREGTPVATDALTTRLQQAANQRPQPALHIEGGQTVADENVAQVLAMTQRAGIVSIGFALDPR